MALFLSTFEKPIDKKARVSVPPQFRAALGNQEFKGIVAYPSFINPAVEASGYDRILQLSESIETFDPFSEERDAFATAILAECQQLPFDTEGRVVLSKRLMEIAGLEDKVIFVGKGRTFELWQPERFAEHQAAARELALANRGRLRLDPTRAPAVTRPAAPASAAADPSDGGPSDGGEGA